MFLIQLENILSNITFSLLFITTCFYWGAIAISPEITFEQSVVPNQLNIIPSTNKAKGFFGNFGIFATITTITLELVLRGWISGHFPLSNLYESLLFLGWSLLLIYQYLEKSLNTTLLGAFIMPVILCIIAFTSFFLPSELQASQPLVPALQSNWLLMHVSVMILSYAGLLIGCILSILYLILSFFSRVNPIKTLVVSSVENTSPISNPSILKIQKLLQILDSVSYRTVGIGFCFLTLGILSGAVWANETWGTYWSWDPKETWAFITWLVFATYLHARFIKGWEGKKPAVIATCGFFVIWMCYLGVNLLGQGLHSYGFFQS
uniref:Cytochrome c biogenesis protein CcsA n=1 Tax=Pseudochloris wilhelmii TaxID=1418016 RepID=A0A097KQJ9_9CHLO|nr:heme attachment to plastid cytochrome c [Pseudochloris wilhelmii]AIT95479.1 heme attachment to plastid cytochrome c [Pseudochloris wilhelmii]